MRTLTYIVCIIIIATSFSFGQQINTHSMIEDGMINITELNTECQSYTEFTPVLSEAELFEIIRLDSSVVFLFYDDSDSLSANRQTYTYNEFDNTLLFVFTYRNLHDTVWQNYSKSLRTFNSDYQEIQTILYSGEGQSWIKRDKYIYEYDNDNVTLSLFYMWDSNVYEWKLYRKGEIDYNSAGLFDQSISSVFNELEQNWIYSSKVEKGYDSFGRVVNYLLFLWNKEESLWEYFRWNYYTYDGDIKSTTYYHYDSTSWLPTDKYIGERIDANNVIFNTYYYTVDSTWFHTDILDLEYDNVDNLISQETYEFLEMDSIWVGNVKIEKTYNDLGQALTRNYYNWIASSNDWVISSNTEYGYNDFGATIYEGTYSWDSIAARWYKGSSKIDYYSNTSSVKNNNSKHSSLSIYPSPCDNQIKINKLEVSNTTYKIYSLSGKLVDTGIIESNNTIFVDKLSRGYHVLKIEVGGKEYSGEFLKL